MLSLGEGISQLNTLNFGKVLIANRGEIAVRAAKVCRAMGLQSLAVYSSVDSNSPHVWTADQAVCIGPPAAIDSYLSIPNLMHVAREFGCDAVYPGYGFLAENVNFAKQCAANGIKFIGPSADSILTMGDKAKARELAASHAIPIVPGSEGAFENVDEAFAVANDVGYPLLLKARSGGGGRGMRVVRDEREFRELFAGASREAEAVFKDGALYLEHFFTDVRHVEVQVLGDGKGNSLVFDERDCSVQRRHQKLVEESPSPVVFPALRAKILKAAKKLTQGICYEGAGTVEFLLEPKTGNFFFIEMNTRIQVEHPVTEMRSGLDLIRAQMYIALGGALDSIKYKNDDDMGHSIEFRINAENWREDFKPFPGVLNKWSPPSAEGVRLDSAVYEGFRISPYYDSMIAKLIVFGVDREDALNKARKALAGFTCSGIETTIDFHLTLLDHPAFRDNLIHTRWIDTGGLRILGEVN